MKWEEIVKTASAAGGACLGYFGGWNDSMTALLIVMVLDYVTGLVVAARGKSPKTENGGISSRVGLDGLIRKIFMLVLVMVASVVDRVIGTNAVMPATIFFFIANEGISIAENAGLMGIALPKVLSKSLEVLKDSSDNSEVPNAKEEPADASDKKEE